MAEEENVLRSIKTSLGVGVDEVAFDVELKLFINSALGQLDQIGFDWGDNESITDNTEWSAILMDETPTFNMVKEYVLLKVKLAFDQPESSHAMNAFLDRTIEIGWRLGIVSDEKKGSLTNGQ